MKNRLTVMRKEKSGNNFLFAERREEKLERIITDAIRSSLIWQKNNRSYLNSSVNVLMRACSQR